MGPARFDPVAIIATLERHRVDYVLIGGLAQVLRGVDVLTGDVDICPSFARGNLERLNEAIAELRPSGVADSTVGEPQLARGPVALQTEHGELKIIASPHGIPSGLVAMRRAASRERISGDVSPLVASAGDLAAMAGALGRDADRERLAMLRRIAELEAGRELNAPAQEQPPIALRGIRPRGIDQRGPRLTR